MLYCVKCTVRGAHPWVVSVLKKAVMVLGSAVMV